MMKTTRIVGVVALGILAVVFGVALSRTRLRAEGLNLGGKPHRLPLVVQGSSPRKTSSPASLGVPIINDPIAAPGLRTAILPTPSLQHQFVELMKKKAERMTEDELKTAAAELQGALAVQDREAESALQEAVIKLAEVVKKYRGTVAAAKASQAMETMGFNPQDKVLNPAEFQLKDEADDFINTRRIDSPTP